MFNWLQNLLGNIDPFGIKARSVAESNLAQQQRLRAEQEIRKQQEIAARQQQPRDLSTPQSQQFNQRVPAVQDQQQAPPLTSISQVQQQGQQQEGGMSGESFADQIIKAVVDPLQAEIESWWKRLDQYDKNNPFAFDEALARASSQERLNPYFDATLNEFMTGVRRSSTRSVEDMTRTIGELNADASKLSDQERLATQEAIRSSEEGFAGSGLFFSGKRERQTGLEEVQGAQAQEGIQTKLSRGTVASRLSSQRLQEDLALQEARQKRLTEAERTTSLEVDIAKQKRESELQRGLERLQFAGKIPGAGPAQQLQLENQFMSGLV